MTTAIKFSRQIDAGSSVSNTQNWENVILVVVLVSESKRLYFSVRSSRSSTSCNGRPSCYYMNRGGGGEVSGPPSELPTSRLHLQLKPIWPPVMERAQTQRSCESNMKRKRNCERSAITPVSSYKVSVSNKRSLRNIFNKSRTHFNSPNFCTNSVWVTLSKSFELTISLEISSWWPSSLRSLLLASYAVIENGCAIFKLGY